MKKTEIAALFGGDFLFGADKIYAALINHLCFVQKKRIYIDI